MDTLEHTAPNITCPEGSLAAILPEDVGSSRIYIIDLAEEVGFSAPASGNVAQVLSKNLTIVADAKANLQTWQVDPHPALRVLCLATIKKLIAKHHSETLNLPSFASAKDVLPWLKQVAHEAFARINKLEMASLCALECRIIPAVMAMEKRGLPFAQSRWQDSLTGIEQECEQLKTRLHDLLPNDNGFLLFGQDPVDLHNANAVKAALEKILGTKLSGTSQSSLKDFDHEAVTLVLRYRELARMLSNFGEAFVAKIDDGRIKGHFTPISSASGRFACHDINLLALPNDETFQACLTPTPPYRVIHFDYGAFELRILAALSGDETLIRIFNDELDIHSMVAQEIFGSTVSKTENAHLRAQAKVLNFGLIYGMGENALAKQLSITKPAAHTMLQNYFKRFSRVGEFLTSLEVTAKTKGYVTTALGRRAYFTDMEDQNQMARLARNIPIQGTGADIAKLALARVYERLHGSGLDAHVINLVHDELVIEVHECDEEEATSLVVQEMKAAFEALCPEVAAEVGS